MGCTEEWAPEQDRETWERRQESWQVSQEERRPALRREGTPRREQGGQGTEAAPSGTSPAGGHVDARRGRGTGTVAEADPGTQTNELAEDEAVPGETPLGAVFL